MTLKEWLKNNKHIKAVTRDRRSAYASAIQEILSDAMQIADRYHLHQNLLDDGKKYHIRSVGMVKSADSITATTPCFD